MNFEKERSVENGSAHKPKKEKPAGDSHRDFLDMDTDEEDFGYQESPESEEELPAEPEKPDFNEQQLNTLVEQVKDLIPSGGELDWHEDCNELIREYFRNPTHTVMSIGSKKTTALVMLELPRDMASGFVYFLRTSYWQIYTPENFLDTVQFGTINSDSANCLLNVFENIYAPAALSSNRWPSITRNNVWTNLYQFLTCLKERIYKPKGLTLLHVPKVSNRAIEGQAHCWSDEEKDFVETLETLVRHWLRQIRETLANVHVRRSNRSITDELVHWNAIHSELSCLHGQLSNNDVSLIIKRLTVSRSPIVETLRSWIDRVKDKLQECSSNVRYLNALYRTCEYFNVDSMDAVVTSARRTLFLVLFMWMESSFYSECEENIERLCRALSWQLIMQCRERITLDTILAGDAETGIEVLKGCISFCRAYEKIYRDLTLNITPIICQHKEWTVNEDKVFQHLHAFVARCYDLIYVCDAIIVFGRCNKVGLLPGTKGTEYEACCREIENMFHCHLKDVVRHRYHALDVVKSNWLEVMVRFRKAIAHLECIVITLIDIVFRTVKTVEEGIEALYALRRFQHRKRINDILQEKYKDVWRIFGTEIKICNADIIEDGDGNTISIMNIKRRYLHTLYTVMFDSLDWLGENCPAAKRTLQQYKGLIVSIDSRVSHLCTSVKPNLSTS